MDYLLYLSKVLEYISFIAVDVNACHDVCANLFRSIWRPQDIDL